MVQETQCSKPFDLFSPRMSNRDKEKSLVMYNLRVFLVELGEMLSIFRVGQSGEATIKLTAYLSAAMSSSAFRDQLQH